MFERWEKYHSIAVWSHYTRYDFPRPFDNSGYYTDVIRNLFENKNSSDVVKIELEDGSDHNSGYMSIKVTPPRINVKINEIVDVPNFINWYSERFGLGELIKREYKNDEGNIVTTFSSNDGYTRDVIIVSESPECDFEKNYLEIKCEFGGGW